MLFFRMYAVVVIVGIMVTTQPLLARRSKDDPENSSRSTMSLSSQRKVNQTFLDTLNKGKEIGLDTVASAVNTPLRQQSQSAPQTGAVTDAPIGFRIQCFASSNLSAVQAHKKTVETDLKMEGYIVFSEPYYKLHIGNFANRQAAESALVHIKQAGYPEAWIVRASGIDQQEVR